jgi:hypothetical protein
MMTQEIQIPTKLSDVTLEQFQAFNRVTDETDNEVFISHKLIAIFCKIRMSDVLRIRQVDCENIANTLRLVLEEKKEFIQRFTLGGKEFGFIPNLEDISSGEYADLETYISDWSTMHKALAVLYRPITKTKGDKYEIEPYEGSATYAEVMQYTPLNIAFGALVFFYHLNNELLLASLNYLQKEMEAINTKQARSSVKNGDGTTTSMRLLKETQLRLKTLQELDYSKPLLFLPMRQN